MTLLNTASKVYVGGSLASKVYLGSTQVWPPASAAPPPTIVGTTVNATSGTAARVVTPHASTAVGDIMIVSGISLSGSTLTAPADWTVLKAHTAAGTMGMGVWAHVRAAGETTYSFPIGATGNSTHVCTTIHGGNAAGLVNGAFGTRAASGGAFTTTAPSITTVAANTLALLLAGERTTATETGITSVDNGFAQVLFSPHSAGGVETMLVASKVAASAGAVGATSVVYPNTQASNGLAMLLGIPPV